ncbi:hypothetical protein Ae201684_011860 [Aphanomyces euteiches]|uniref:Uncharacterized protein n=1 Tax=Aphanomyces euteiches TaxID=100861 RepID=A0A6G0WTI9_9STRA|nr:hypothetical protein Ae201684_011860 [Aphanomyces euteiches]
MPRREVYQRHTHYHMSKRQSRSSSGRKGNLRQCTRAVNKKEPSNRSSRSPLLQHLRSKPSIVSTPTTKGYAGKRQRVYSSCS